VCCGTCSRKRARTDFGFDPVADGVLAAAERLAKARRQVGCGEPSCTGTRTPAFPNVLTQLRKVQPPNLGLFPDKEQLAGYPQANEQSEAPCAKHWQAVPCMDAAQARIAILGSRKGTRHAGAWLWASMGLARRWQWHCSTWRVWPNSALPLPIGRRPTELALNYQQSGWLVDEAALRTWPACSPKPTAMRWGLPARGLFAVA
jgi:hypothetical protein